jgi:hypothetical protein
VITLPYLPSDYSEKTPPPLRISRATELMDPDKLMGVSCLMMSDTRLFLNFAPSWAATTIETQESLLREWEQNFEETLRLFQMNELSCYGEFGFIFFFSVYDSNLSQGTYRIVSTSEVCFLSNLVCKNIAHLHDRLTRSVRLAPLFDCL